MDFVWVVVPVICTLVFVVVPVCSGVLDDEDSAFKFETPNWVEYWKSPPAAMILRPKPEVVETPVETRSVGGVQA